MGAKGDVEMTSVDGGGATTGVAEGEEDGAPAVDATIDEDVDLAQKMYDHERARDDESREAVLAIVRKREMATTMEELCERFGWTRDEGAVKRMREANERRLREIDAKIEDAKENLGDVEVRDAMYERARFYASVGECEKACEAYEETEEKTASVGQKMDGAFAMMRVRFSRLELQEVKKLIAKIKELLDQPGGGDWERKNRLKVYEGLYSAA